jgi:hypothetical protein
MNLSRTQTNELLFVGFNQDYGAHAARTRKPPAAGAASPSARFPLTPRLLRAPPPPPSLPPSLPPFGHR